MTTTTRDEFIEGIADSALYGGIGYWAQASDVGTFGNRNRCTIREFDEGTGEPIGEPIHLLPAIREGLRKVRDPETKINPTLRGTIIAADMERDGCNIDATAADVIVQLGALGEITYG